MTYSYSIVIKIKNKKIIINNEYMGCKYVRKNRKLKIVRCIPIIF